MSNGALSADPYLTLATKDKAIVSFADWLTTLVVEREVSYELGSGSASVVLCGHSMGGLLAADSLREFMRTRPDQSAPLWPKIIACIAFDTPVRNYCFRSVCCFADWLCHYSHFCRRLHDCGYRRILAQPFSPATYPMAVLLRKPA